MSLKYNNVNIVINSRNILCDSVSVSQNSPQKSVYTLNNSKPFDYISQSLRNTLEASYYIEPGKDPSYEIISGWKNDTTGNLNTLINFGGIEFVGYLSSYSFNVTPNSPIVANVTYQIFNPITGNFDMASSGNSDLYNTDNSLGIAHYWSVNFTSGGNAVANNNVLQCNYSFNSNVVPNYKLGSYYPSQISCMDASEEINVTNTIQNNLDFTGGSYGNIMDKIDNLRLNNLSSSWGNTLGYLDFSLSGFYIQSSASDLKVDDIILFSHNMSKSY